jgi:hypothetical protein
MVVKEGTLCRTSFWILGCVVQPGSNFVKGRRCLALPGCWAGVWSEEKKEKRLSGVSQLLMKR